MRTSTWIKLIGILCIVFGVFGIWDSLSLISIVEMVPLMTTEETFELSPKAQSLLTGLGYLGILVYTFYLMAGIFFLLKKTFSLNMMYIALLVSVLFKIIPLIIINESLGRGLDDFLFNYRIDLFSNLLSPALDMALLIGIKVIGKNYYKTPEAIQKAKIFTPKLLKILTFLGLLCLSIPLSLQGLWIYAFNQAANQADRVAIFNSYLPEFQLGRYTPTFLGAAFCLLAIILSSVSLKLSGKLWKSFNIVTLVVSSLLLLLHLFQLM